jgi:hypothetical protein
LRTKLLAVLFCAAGSIWGQSAPYHAFVWTGQSLACGLSGGGPLTTSQPYSNVTPTAGGFVPLVEATVESPRSAAANQLTSLASPPYVAALVNGCLGNTAYAGLKKGTAPYANAIASIGYGVANKGANSFTANGVLVTHGESDEAGPTTKAQYLANLLEWQSDYEADLKAATGQSGAAPMFLDQMASWNYYGHAEPKIALAQWEAARDNPGTHILVGPKYQYTYVDGVHLLNTSYRALGQMYGKVLERVLIDGEAWKPLSPVSITRAGAVITATFHVPSGLLAIDTTTVSDKGAGKGFEFFDNSGAPPAITSVSVSGSIATITLASTPTGGGERLRYAYMGTPGAAAGSAASAHGNIRDTDATVGLYGDPLYDWLITFDEPVSAAKVLFPLPSPIHPTQLP